MAGDKVVGSSSYMPGEKAHQIDACNVNLNLEDEFAESIEYIPCPEFQFSVSYLNHYYVRLFTKLTFNIIKIEYMYICI